MAAASRAAAALSNCGSAKRRQTEVVERTPWIAFLAAEPKIRSTTSVCLTFADPNLDKAAAARLAAAMVKLLEAEGAALDIGPYRSAPPGLRIWAGPTVAAADLAAMLPWLDWAFAECRSAIT